MQYYGIKIPLNEEKTDFLWLMDSRCCVDSKPLKFDNIETAEIYKNKTNLKYGVIKEIPELML